MPRVARSTDTTIDSLWPPTDPTGVVTVGIADLSGNLVTATATEPTIGNKDGLFEYKLAGDLSPDVDFRKGHVDTGHGPDPVRHIRSRREPPILRRRST